MSISHSVPEDIQVVERERWRTREVIAAIEEANAGQFASDEEVSALARKWANLQQQKPGQSS